MLEGRNKVEKLVISALVHDADFINKNKALLDRKYYRNDICQAYVDIVKKIPAITNNSIQVSIENNIKNEKARKKLLMFHKLIWKAQVNKKAADWYADELKKYSRVDQTTKFMREYLEQVEKGEFDKAEKGLIRGLLTATTEDFDIDMIEYGEDFEARQKYIKDLSEGKIESRGIMSGFRRFDELSGGIFPGELGLIIGYPGVGKSVLLSNWLLHAVNNGKTVITFSTEMPARQIAFRVDSMISGLQHRNTFRLGEVEEKTFKVWSDSINKYKKGKGKFYIVTLPMGGTIEDINSTLEILEQRGIKPDVVGVDTLDMLGNCSKSWSEQHEQGELATQLKFLAIKRNLAVLAITYRKNVKEEDEKDRLTLRDMGYSQRKSQRADFVVVLFETDIDKEQGLLSFQALKVRDAIPDILFKMKADFPHMKLEEVGQGR